MSVDINGLQSNVYNLLIAANICAGRIYNDVPQGALTMPYLQFAGAFDMEDDDSTGDGLERHIMLSAWSEYDGEKELNSIITAVRDAVHHQTFATNAGTNALVFIDSTQNLGAADGETWQAIIRLRIIATT